MVEEEGEGPRQKRLRRRESIVVAVMGFVGGVGEWILRREELGK